MFGLKRRRSNYGNWSKMTALGVGLGVASYALKRNRGSQNNMLTIPGNNQDTQS